MKKLISLLAILMTFGLLAPIAEAGHSNRRVVGYNQCGDAVYATWRAVSYQRCGRPNYAWVRDRVSSSCSRPGRCNHHGHAHARTSTVFRSGSSSLRVGYVSPRLTIRSHSIGRSYRPSSSFRRSSSSRSRSCR